MSEYIVQDTTLTNIANAIRSKTGNSNSITVPNMANEISNISTKSDLSFITAAAEHIQSGYVGADKDGNPVNGTRTVQLYQTDYSSYRTEFNKQYYPEVNGANIIGFTFPMPDFDPDILFIAGNVNTSPGYGSMPFLMIDFINNRCIHIFSSESSQSQYYTYGYEYCYSKRQKAWSACPYKDIRGQQTVEVLFEHGNSSFHTPSFAKLYALKF